LLAAATLACLSTAAASPAGQRTGAESNRRTRWSRSAEQSPDGFYYQPAGLCDDFPDDVRTRERIRRNFDVMRQCGARLFRCGVSWSTIERSKGEYDWAFWDMLVDEAARYHITLIPYVCYTPEWAASGANDAWKQPPKDPKSFGDFMFLIASRYRGRVPAWELWNEPDIDSFWLGNTQQFADMIRSGADGVRRGDPAAAIVLGGMSQGDAAFFRDLVERHRLLEIVDVVNVHRYHESWDESRLEEMDERLASFTKRVDANSAIGRRPDIWMAEFGYSSYRYSLNRASQWGISIVSDYEHTASYQAAALFKAHALALGTGRLSLTAWYRVNDLEPSVRVIGDDVNRHLGVVTVNGARKPAFYALRHFNRLFDGPARRLDEKKLADGPARSQSVVRIFEKRDGTLILVAWLRSRRPDEAGGRSGWATDTRRETLSVAIPRKAGPVSLSDEQGNAYPYPATISSTRVSNLTLVGDKVLVARIAPVPASSSGNRRNLQNRPKPSKQTRGVTRGDDAPKTPASR
jgi:hypothetical protein